MSSGLSVQAITVEIEIRVLSNQNELTLFYILFLPKRLHIWGILKRQCWLISIQVDSIMSLLEYQSEGFWIISSLCGFMDILNSFNDDWMFKTGRKFETNEKPQKTKFSNKFWFELPMKMIISLILSDCKYVKLIVV